MPDRLVLSAKLSSSPAAPSLLVGDVGTDEVERRLVTGPRTTRCRSQSWTMK